MKKLFLLCSLSFGIALKAQTVLSFTITNATGSPSITCAYPSINLTVASSYTGGLISYAWSGPGTSSTGTALTVSNPGTYTVVASSGNLGTVTHTISIASNTVQPASIVVPGSQTISCGNSAVTVSAVATSPTINVQHNFLSPYGGSASVSNYLGIYNAQAPGTYTDVLINTVNGCSLSTTFTIVSTPGSFPSFNITSPQNFTLGCSPSNLASVMISNAFANGAAISYTLLNVLSSPSYSTGQSATYALSTPGTYTVVVRNNNTGCEAKVPITITQNTAAPIPSITALTRTLNCGVSSITVQATSSATNATYAWASAGTPTPGSSLVVSTLTANATNSIIANYSLTVLDNSNACAASTVITMYQNIYPPKANIGSSSNALTCLSPSITLTNSSTSGIPPNTFGVFSPVIGMMWQVPAPQATLANASTYMAYTPGIYTLTALDLNNSCISNTTIVIGDNRIYPVIVANLLVCIDAAHPTVMLASAIAGAPAASVSYSWTTSPNANVSGLNTGTLTTNTVGIYTLAATSNSNSCSTLVNYTVTLCSLLGINNNKPDDFTLKVYPNPGSGLFTLDLSNTAAPVELHIYNLLGGLIKKQLAAPGSNEIDLKQQPNGVYIIKTDATGKMGGFTKIIKQD